MSSTTPALTKDLLSKKEWTQAEFHQLPEGPPYYELEDGELIEMPRPRLRHQEIVGHLFAVISTYVRENELGKVWPEVEVDITSTKTYVPDLIFVAVENLDRIEDDKYFVGPPDLVVEMLSPSTAARDKSQKLKTYQKAGVPWYWLIEPDSLLIYEYKNTPDGYLLAEILVSPEVFSPQLFPDLTINLAPLMGELSAEENQHE
jgi:Uma2 family endonuclease